MEVIFMKEDEIKKGIQLICKTSEEMSKYFDDRNALIDKLNSLHKEKLAPLEYEFRLKSGAINDLREEMLKYLLDGNKLDEQKFEELILKHRIGNEEKFKAFTEFLIFQQFLARYEHNQIGKFIEQLKDEIIERLQLKKKVKYDYLGFQGRPHQGTEQFWLEIYNSKQNSKSAGLKLFIEFQDCRIRYGVKHRSDKSFRDRLQEQNSSNFDFEILISLFEEKKELILKDEP